MALLTFSRSTTGMLRGGPAGPRGAAIKFPPRGGGPRGCESAGAAAGATCAAIAKTPLPFSTTTQHTRER